jgi:3-isopropylmalate/(R)-2-methylmalate dehydratase small subunit
MSNTLTSKVFVVYDNIDTDQIIPAQYLTLVPTIAEEYEKLGSFALIGLPDDKYPVDLVESGKTKSDYQIVIAGRNFGCGSSREHAPWALQQYGFRAIIAPSFADIFYNNCFKNGLLPIVLSEQQVDHLFNETYAFNGFQLTVDLEAQVVRSSDGAAEYPFEVAAFRKYCLLNGFDDIGLTLRHADEIRQFEAERIAKQPWLAHRIVG